MTAGVIEYCYFEKNESTFAQHSESIALEWGANDWHIRYNVWENCMGTAFIIGPSCSYIRVYGNVFRDGPWMGMLFGGWTYNAAEPGRPMNEGGLFYNNTIVNYGKPAIGSHSPGVISKNNLFYFWDIPDDGQSDCDPTFTGTASHNAFMDSDAFGSTDAQLGITSDIFVDYAGKDYRLASPTSSGTPLPYPYNTDMFGNIRGGNDGVWDRGAYEYVTGPRIDNVITTRRVVTWETSVPANSVVHVIYDPGMIISNSTFTTAHSLNLTNADLPSANMYCRVQSSDSEGNTSITPVFFLSGENLGSNLGTRVCCGGTATAGTMTQRP